MLLNSDYINKTWNCKILHIWDSLSGFFNFWYFHKSPQVQSVLHIDVEHTILRLHPNKMVVINFPFLGLRGRGIHRVCYLCFFHKLIADAIPCALETISYYIRDLRVKAVSLITAQSLTASTTLRNYCRWQSMLCDRLTLFCNDISLFEKPYTYKCMW